ncbi:hypothetical protein MUK42_35921 [Musa troglodytarum]|uniref:Uncharacterized protein n=1 Tax=Musa troglodytarum TaxID=320322 RepID=A0A9E7GAV6_9LILI|nr:hypothetical protein MUK42_35921 [Musa troglodytarum]
MMYRLAKPDPTSLESPRWAQVATILEYAIIERELRSGKMSVSRMIRQGVAVQINRPHRVDPMRLLKVLSNTAASTPSYAPQSPQNGCTKYNKSTLGMLTAFLTM